MAAEQPGYDYRVGVKKTLSAPANVPPLEEVLFYPGTYRGRTPAQAMEAAVEKNGVPDPEAPVTLVAITLRNWHERPGGFERNFVIGSTPSEVADPEPAL